MMHGHLLFVCARCTNIALYGGAGGVRRLIDLFAMSCSRYVFVDMVMCGLGQTVGWKEIQGCESQKGRDWGVRTHHDFGGAERQSNFYIKD